MYRPSLIAISLLLLAHSVAPRVAQAQFPPFPVPSPPPVDAYTRAQVDGMVNALKAEDTKLRQSLTEHAPQETDERNASISAAEGRILQALQQSLDRLPQELLTEQVRKQIASTVEAAIRTELSEQRDLIGQLRRDLDLTRRELQAQIDALKAGRP